MKRFKGFTLIELLIVVAIIGILTGLASLAYSTINMRSRDAKRSNDLAQIKIALSTYYNAQIPAQYVASSGDTPPAKITINSTNDALTAALEPNFIRDIPLDPVNSGSNVYKYQSFLTNNINANFKLYATFENKNNTKGWGTPQGTGWIVDGYVLQNE